MLAAQNPKDIELLVGDAVAFEERGVSIQQPIGRIKQIDYCFLMCVSEFGLFYLFFNLHKTNP